MADDLKKEEVTRIYTYKKKKASTFNNLRRPVVSIKAE